MVLLLPFPFPPLAEYVLTMPNMYARGILFGKMVLELGDTCTVRNGAHNFHADLEFKTKGFFSGTYNAIAGRVKRGSTDLGDVSGKWSALMEFKPAKVRQAPSSLIIPVHHVPSPILISFYFILILGCKTGEKRTLFDALKSGHDVAPKWIAPEDEQEPYESRRLWRDLTRAILAKDMDAATEAKTAIETAQREVRASGVKHTTRFFELRDDRCWVPRIQCVAFLFSFVFPFPYAKLKTWALDCNFSRIVVLQASTGSTRGHCRSTRVDLVPVIRR
jgi:hypothetical protein